MNKTNTLYKTNTSRTISNIVPITQATVDANGPPNAKNIFTNNSASKGIQKKEHTHHVFLCEGNSEVVIPVSWTLRLSCGLKTFTNTTEVVWHYKDENNVTWNNPETKNTSEKLLELTNVSLSHSGNYSCSIKKKTCHRTILVKGRLNRYPHNIYTVHNVYTWQHKLTYRKYHHTYDIAYIPL